MSQIGFEDSLDGSLNGRTSRRLLLKRSVALGLSAPVVAGLLAACGGDDEEDAPAGGSDASTPSTSDANTPEAESEPTTAADDGSDEEEATPEGDASSSDGEAAAGTGSIIVADGTEPESLSPPQGTGVAHPINAIYEGLVEFSGDRELTPKLATSWEASDDGTEWTFELREGVKFHDGTDFNSAAVKATYEHLVDPDLAANRRGNYLLIQEVDDSEDLTVRFVTDPPNPDFVSLMTDSSSFIVSPTALEQYGADFGRNPVGTGPFKFVEWIPNDHVSAERFEDYWGEKPAVQTFVYRPIPEVSTRVVVLQTGEVDVVFNLPSSDLESLEQTEGVTIHTEPSLSVVMMEPRVSVPPLDDARVRRALNMAIDKDAILSNVMGGNALPLTTPGVPGLAETVNFDPLAFDPEGAKALLAEAGYPDGIQVNITYTGGRFPGDDQVVQAVQGYWSMIGVEATINRTDYATFVDTLRRDPAEMPGEILMPSRSSVTNDYHIYRMYHSEATHADAAQRSGYSNPEVDELLNAEREEFDPEARAKIFAQIQELLWEDQPMIYLMQQVELWGQRDNVSGFTINGQGNFVPAQANKS